jgi:hypothetical protein
MNSTTTVKSVIKDINLLYDSILKSENNKEEKIVLLNAEKLCKLAV